MVLRILVLNYEFPPLGGGASPVSYEIAKGYVKLGHSVDVVTMGFKGLPAHEKKDGINIYRVPCLRSKKEICHPWEQLTYIISAKRFLKNHLKTHSYDINHTHFIIPTGIISLWLKKKYGLPYIITSHGSDVPGYNPDRFKILHTFTKPTLKKILDSSKGVFTSSFYLANLIKINVESSTPVNVIREGFDHNKFKPRPKKKIILSTGRLLDRKGFQYLIRSVQNKSYGYDLHICGMGPMMSTLKELAKDSRTKIVFHGWLENNSGEYKNLIERSEIYCLLSSQENSSISLLEAMSAGCVLITSNATGCKETVGKAGFTVEAKNINEIRKILSYISKNPSISKKYGKLA